MMRKFLITAAVAGSAFAVAAPAAAQWGPAPPPPAPYGYGYGQPQAYNNWGYVRSLQVRVNNLQRRIERFDSRDRITEREARRLREDVRGLEQRLRRASRNGLNPIEARNIEFRLARIEQRLVRDLHDGRRWGQTQWGNGYYDRDRDGLDDRWEDDRGRRRD